MWSKNEGSSQQYNDETKVSNASTSRLLNNTSGGSSSNSMMTATSPAIVVAPGVVTRNADGSSSSGTGSNTAIDIATAARHSLVFPTVHVVEVGSSKDNNDNKSTKNQTVRFVNNDVIENQNNSGSTTSLFQKVVNVFGRSQSSDTNKMNINVPYTTATTSMFFEEECASPAVTAAAATTLLPESLTTKPVKHVQVSDETLESIDTITLSSSVSTPTIPSIHNATNDFAHASRSGSTQQYQQAHDDHIPIIPSFVPHLGSHHHVHIPHRHHYIPHRHHVLKKHIQKQLEDTAVDVEVDEVAEVNTFHDLLAGGIAGSASVIVGHPFDTMKVRMQTNGSIGGSLMSTNAVKGLFRGMAPPLGAAGLVNALVFSSYGWSNRMWDQYYGTEEEQKAVSEEKDGFKFNWKAYWCGCFAGLAQTFVLTPTEHIKCRLQVQQSNGGGGTAASTVYKGPRDAAAQIVKSHGLKGLYRGFHITAWREVPAFGLYFTSYDYLKEAISKQLAQRNMDQPWIASGISGGVSGCLTWLVVYPTDVIKSRIQTQSLNCRKGIITTGKEIYREGGVRLLFRGLGITLLRAFPVNGVIFPVYEFALLQLTGGDQMLD